MDKKYTWELWDYASPINGCLPQDTGFIGIAGIYLIKDNEGHTIRVQSELERPYKDVSLEECAIRDCEDENAAAELETIEKLKQESEVTN